MSAVTDKDLIQALERLRDLRLWAHRTKADPWAVRQALLTALEMDTHAARSKGIRPTDLEWFDQRAKRWARICIKKGEG